MKNDQRQRLQDKPMALAFFDGSQLARGVAEPEGSRTGSLRRLYSETALQARLETSSLRSPSRPRTSHRDSYRGSRLAAERPATSSGHPASQPTRQTAITPAERPRTAVSTPAEPKTYRAQVTASGGTDPPTSKWNKMLQNVKKPSFVSLKRENQAASGSEPKKSPEWRSWKRKEKERRSEEKDKSRPQTAQQTVLPRSETTSQPPPPPSQSAIQAQPVQSPAYQPVQPPQPQPRTDTPATARSATTPSMFLAEALAHVIVGEWLYKDPNRPGIFPQKTMLRRRDGPPPRGATGVPQRRWFRIDPYERLLVWSSKWDTVEPAQHKMNRKVPIKLVFEIPNRLSLDGCIPANVSPYDYSIVLVAPSKVIKITAPDETRHSLWLTALQYLAGSNKNVEDQAWPDVLAARLAALTQPLTGFFRGPLRTDKPLPPSPPVQKEDAPSIVPQSIPRFPQHVRDPSAGLSTNPDDDAQFSPISEVASRASSDRRSQKGEPYTPSDEKGKAPERTPRRDVPSMPGLEHMDELLSRLA